MTRLIVCCDGTWNTPDESTHDTASPTNVAKLARAVATGGDQVLYYETGVGTTPDDHLLGGAFGLGLSQNIRNAYQFLAQSYAPGDALFLFGFSRGAYTARSLAGLVHNCGILRPEHADRVDEAFALYRDRTSRTRPSSLTSQIFREMYAQDSDEVAFIGVWDTVGALGIPAGVPGWREIVRRIKSAYHALAIDEQRLPFQPTLWTGTPAPDQTVEQVWFAGVHTEVGGGSGDASLSDIALLWIVQQAIEHGLVLKPGQLRIEPGDDVAGNTVSPNYAGPIVNSRHGAWSVIRAYHRLREITINGGPGQSLASSVLRRLHAVDGEYRPPGIDGYLAANRVTPVVEHSRPPDTGPPPTGPVPPSPVAVTPGA